jgi:endonuclease YncB( thermonuclease family)
LRGKLLPFRRRKSAPPRLGPHGTGGLTGNRRLPQPARFGKPRRRASTWRGAFRSLRPWLLLIALLTLAFILKDAPSVSIPYLSGTQRQEIPALAWQSCDRTAGARHCVVDGDTVRIAGETIRVTGLDTPELAGACEAERIAARAARDALTAWLNEGAFTIAGNDADAQDKYGRPLRAFTRGPAAGSSVAEALIARGVARPYAGGARPSWCS